MSFPKVSQLVSIVSGIHLKTEREKIAHELIRAARENDECYFPTVSDETQQAVIKMYGVGVLLHENVDSFTLAPDVIEALREFSVSSEGYLSGSVAA